MIDPEELTLVQLMWVCLALVLGAVFMSNWLDMNYQFHVIPVKQQLLH